MCDYLFYKHLVLPGGRVDHSCECRHPKTPHGVCPYPAKGFPYGHNDCPLGRDNDVDSFEHLFPVRS